MPVVVLQSSSIYEAQSSNSTQQSSKLAATVLYLLLVEGCSFFGCWGQFVQIQFHNPGDEQVQ